MHQNWSTNSASPILVTAAPRDLSKPLKMAVLNHLWKTLKEKQKKSMIWSWRWEWLLLLWQHIWNTVSLFNQLWLQPTARLNQKTNLSEKTHNTATPTPPGFPSIDTNRAIRRRRANTKSCQLRRRAHLVRVQINRGIMYACWNICVWHWLVHVWWKSWSAETHSSWERGAGKKKAQRAAAVDWKPLTLFLKRTDEVSFVWTTSDKRCT